MKTSCEAMVNSSLLTKDSPPGLKVTQITSGKSSNSHIYMESHVFTPDSRRFVFERFLNPLETDPRKMRRNYFLCDLDDHCRVMQLTEEENAIAPSITSDGKYFYYLVDDSSLGSGCIHLKRVSLQNFQHETLKIYHGIGGVFPSRIYILSSISKNGDRLCIAAFLGDGVKENPTWGLIVFNLYTLEAAVVLEGREYCNLHPQYCWADSMEAQRDILIQANHGCAYDAHGNITTLVSGLGADIHVVREDGTLMRSLPWGRDGYEFCQGHQQWRGCLDRVVGHMIWGDETCCPIIESFPVSVTAENMHDGKRLKNGRRNLLTENFQRPCFFHSSFDPTGTRFITDADFSRNQDPRETVKLYFSHLSTKDNAKLDLKYLLHPRTSFTRGQYTHPHPFFSPDGKRAFFNSDFTGHPHIWMVEGFV